MTHFADSRYRCLCPREEANTELELVIFMLLRTQTVGESQHKLGGLIQELKREFGCTNLRSMGQSLRILRTFYTAGRLDSYTMALQLSITSDNTTFQRTERPNYRTLVLAHDHSFIP